MSQHDYDLANQNGASFRADLNDVLAAIQSMNSGATEPASTAPYMLWADTNAGLWKVRNAADSAWVSVMSLTASRIDTALGVSYDNDSSGLSAENVKAAIDELAATGAFEKATTDQAEAGENDTAFMTPLKNEQHYASRFSSSAENIAGAVEGKAVDPLGIREAFNASGSAPVYACRAWVNFNGTGTVSIRASGNVSSVTDDGVGAFTINLTNSMPDTSYSAIASVSRGDASTSSTNIAVMLRDSISVNSFRVVCRTGSDTVQDPFNANIAVFR